MSLLFIRRITTEKMWNFRGLNDEKCFVFSVDLEFFCSTMRIYDSRLLLACFFRVQRYERFGTLSCLHVSQQPRGYSFHCIINRFILLKHRRPLFMKHRKQVLSANISPFPFCCYLRIFHFSINTDEMRSSTWHSPTFCRLFVTKLRFDRKRFKRVTRW